MTVKFVVSPVLGGVGQLDVHEVPTDLLLLTKLASTPLGPGPSAVNRDLNGLISREMQLRRFKGELGSKLLFDLNPGTFPDASQRYVLLVGVGSSQNFNGRAACRIFQELVDEALRLGVEKITVPVAPHRMTGGKLNLKGTAHILKEVVETRLADCDEEPALKTVEILCSPQATRHIEAGLLIPSRHKRVCCIDEDES